MRRDETRVEEGEPGAARDAKLERRQGVGPPSGCGRLLRNTERSHGMLRRLREQITGWLYRSKHEKRSLGLSSAMTPSWNFRNARLAKWTSTEAQPVHFSLITVVPNTPVPERGRLAINAKLESPGDGRKKERGQLRDSERGRE